MLRYPPHPRVGGQTHTGCHGSSGAGGFGHQPAARLTSPSVTASARDAVQRAVCGGEVPSRHAAGAWQARGGVVGVSHGRASRCCVSPTPPCVVPKGVLCWGRGSPATFWVHRTGNTPLLWPPAPEAGSCIPPRGEAFGLAAAQGFALIDAPASLNTSQGSMDKAGNCPHRRDVANPPGRALL